MDKIRRFLKESGLWLLAALFVGLLVYGWFAGSPAAAWIGGAGAVVSALIKKLTGKGDAPAPLKFT